MLNTIHFYRQVNPTDDNPAAKSLSRERQIYNIKLVALNARVTWVVWILEFVACFTIIIAWVFVVGTTSFATLTNSMIWLYVLIPYTFLMNTSYNKERIIDEGWKTVIMNSLFDLKGCFSRNETIPTSPNLRRQPTDPGSNVSRNRIQQTKKEFIFTKTTPNTTPPPTQQNDSSTKSSLENNISIIATHEFDLPSSKTASHLHIEDLELKPSNSKGNSDNSQRHTINCIDQNSSFDSDEEIGDRLRKKKIYRIRIGEKLLSRMDENINNEDAYIHYFRQLVDFEDLLKSGQTFKDSKFRIKPFSSPKVMRKCQVKRSSKDIHNESRVQKVQTKSKNKNQTQENHSPLNINYSVDYVIRAQLRRGMLKHFQIFCDQQNSYDDFISSIIELEERLIKC